MSDLRQAASFALTTLQGWKNYDHWLWPPSALGQAKQNTTEAISLLEVALAEPEPEPTENNSAELAADIRRFLHGYQQMRGLDPENIYSIHRGDALEAHLRVSQLARISEILEAQ